MSDTPRTDALYAKIAAEMGLGVGKIDPAEAHNLILVHCRKLERELAEADEWTRKWKAIASEASETIAKLKHSAQPEAALTTVEFCGKPAAAPCAIAEQCQYGKDSDTIIEACAQVCDTEAALSVGMYREIREALAERIRGLKRSQPQKD
jgi:enoyl-CoA hydratase/carnithine racemase